MWAHCDDVPIDEHAHHLLEKVHMNIGHLFGKIVKAGHVVFCPCLTLLLLHTSNQSFEAILTHLHGHNLERLMDRRQQCHLSFRKTESRLEVVRTTQGQHRLLVIPDCIVGDHFHEDAMPQMFEKTTKVRWRHHLLFLVIPVDGAIFHAQQEMNEMLLTEDTLQRLHWHVNQQRRDAGQAVGVSGYLQGIIGVVLMAPTVLIPPPDKTLNRSDAPTKSVHVLARHGAIERAGAQLRQRNSLNSHGVLLHRIVRGLTNARACAPVVIGTINNRSARNTLLPPTTRAHTWVLTIVSRALA